MTALTLFQAEWCPYSAAAREALTEVGLDFVARQVEPEPEDRRALRELTGTDVIPVLVDERGGIHRGTREIFRYLESRDPWEWEEPHRGRFVEHRAAREADAVGKLVARFRRDRPGPDLGESPDAAVVVDAPESSRYELRVGDRLVGIAAYRLDDDAIAFTHTEVDAACEGRGFGTRLVRDAVEDARRRGLAILPLCSFVAAYVRRHPR